MFNPESPPELDIAGWLNVDQPLTLKQLRGRVVFLLAFQTHCPASLQHALPQARRLAAGLDPSQVVVLGLNTPFESRDAQTREKVVEFADQQKLRFPIALDRIVEGAERTATMAAYELQGTPSILMFDRQGRLRRAYLGEASDIRIAAELMALAIEHQSAPRETSIAIERMLRATLVDPQHEHDHEGDCCGGGHGRDHGHHHHHGHDGEHHHHHADGSCCNDPDCGQS